MRFLNLLNLGKRGPRYNGLPSHRNDTTKLPDWHNMEVRKDFDEESFDSASDVSSTSSQTTPGSSRNKSGSHRSDVPLYKKRVSSMTLPSQIRYRLPTRMVQKFCFFMIASLVGFILFLIRMSYVSQRHLAEHRPDPKPQWESFEFLTRYTGGIRTLVPLSENKPEYPLTTEESVLSNGSLIESQVTARIVPASKAFNAYPDYKSEAYLNDFFPVNECFLDAKQSTRIPPVRYYDGRPNGFPNHVMGSYEVLDLPEDICFERFGRLGPYGHGYGLHLGGLGTGQFGDKEGSEAVWSDIHEVDYRKVDWADAQKRCYKANAARFHNADEETQSVLLADYIHTERAVNEPQATASTNDTNPQKQTLPRSAVVVRLWDDYKYREDDILTLRALIAELSLGSGGEYDVHLLIQVHNRTVPIWADKAIYDAHIRWSVPEEFWGITTLWTESQSELLYPNLEETWARGPNLAVHGVYRGSNMALQNFAVNHPEYDYFWNWEIDARYTGHYYDLLTKLGKWTKAQPRKLLWERNARFYIPSVHGSWEDFMHMARVQTESGTDSVNNLWSPIDPSASGKEKPSGDRPIWGPERPKNPSDWLEIENDPIPPTTFAQDKHAWGVGEDADLITLNPMFDPEGTTWGLAKDITGYRKTSEDGADIGFAPRRSVITNVARLSRRLLTIMHRETAIGHHHAFTEMWPSTVALQHGYKAVYAPQPMFIDRKWPIQYLAATMNGGRNGATGGSRMSPFGDREHNFRGTTWYYNSGFAGNLWKRWLGLKIDNLGGERFELEGEGRMCIPPMLLHPIKEVDIPVENMALGVEEAEFGPSD